MRIMLVASSGGLTGGGERHLLDLAGHLVRSGDEVTAATPPGPLGAALAAAGAAVIEAPIDRAALRAARLVGRAVRRVRPDVVHSHGGRAGLAARLAAFGEGAAIVHTAHGIHFDRVRSLRRLPLGLAEAALAGVTDAFIMVCRADLERGVRLGVVSRARALVIHNAVDCARFDPAGPAGRVAQTRSSLGVEPDDLVALFVGRFHRQKDLPTLLRAWATLPADAPRSRLVLVGDGPERSAVESLAAELGLDDGRVIFAGPSDEPAPLYAAADLVVLSSQWEGLPYTVLEAMASARPVVATAVDGIPEAVVDGSTGLLVPPGDPGLFAAAVARLARDAGLRDAMGAAGRERACGNFGIESMLAATRGVYQELLSD